MEAGIYCETPAFALNPNYAMSDTVSFNLPSTGLLAQRLAWSISNHYSSLESFIANILNSSNSDTPNMEVLANVSNFIQQSILPDISDVNVSSLIIILAWVIFFLPKYYSSKEQAAQLTL